MSEHTLRLALDDAPRFFRAGDTLSGEYRIEAPQDDPPEAVEISVLWYTEGKGDEDMAVHFFERVSSAGPGSIDLRQPRRFRTVLPNSPLSYEGVMVRIRWCVRLRVFLARGKELVEERPIQLGDIPAARAVLP